MGSIMKNKIKFPPGKMARRQDASLILSLAESCAGLPLPLHASLHLIQRFFICLNFGVPVFKFSGPSLSVHYHHPLLNAIFGIIQQLSKCLLILVFHHTKSNFSRLQLMVGFSNLAASSSNPNEYHHTSSMLATSTAPNSFVQSRLHSQKLSLKLLHPQRHWNSILFLARRTR